jgi:HAD superfamily hydrolase (TIGR01549 family)
MSNLLDLKNLEQYQVIIFDMDGTLYNHKKLKRFILLEFIKYYLPRPWRISELLIISVFRKEREKHAGERFDNLYEVQYQWASKLLNCSIESIKEVVNKWMFKKPLLYLEKSKYKWVDDTFSLIRQKNKKIVIYSDYPAEDKMQAMNLHADQLFSAIDPEINALKPSGEGLNWICEKNGISAKQCLFIGDRDDRDGECARKVGMPYYILSHEEKN